MARKSLLLRAADIGERALLLLRLARAFVRGSITLVPTKCVSGEANSVLGNRVQTESTPTRLSNVVQPPCFVRVPGNF